MRSCLLTFAAMSLTAAGLVAATPAAARTAFTELVSVDAAGGPANESSFVQGLDDRGRFVAFTSFASDLVPGDTNGALNPNSGIDVFVRDRIAATTERVNVSSAGRQADGSSLDATLSADGRVVAFESEATNLVAGDTNACQDVFVHDRRSGVTERVSVSSAGAQANTDSFNGSVSRNGRFVAFSSTASNLVPGDANGRTDVFVHDRRTGATEIVSVGSAGARANGDSFSPSISADGRVVAFTSFASNLAPGDTNANSDVLVHDRGARTTQQVSVSSAGANGNAASAATTQALSASGRFATFQSLASNLVPADTNGQQDVLVHDRRSRVTERVSVSPAGGQANGLSQGAAISAHGRFVVFDSLASNLLPGDAPFTPDLFLRDRRTGAIELVNVSSAGERGGSSGPALPSANGRVVAFGSLASNLVPGDTNGFSDVFVRVRRGR
jgi:Tol biopolymer transport system component